MRIRPETPADHRAVADVVTEAFGGRPGEALLVDLIRRSAGFDPDLSLVAEVDGAVAGHALFSRITVAGEGPREVYCLAPLSVHPGHQDRGIGSALTAEGLRILDQRGEPLVMVEGIPSYYPRFGFEPASRYGLLPPDPNIPDEAFMVLRLAAYDPSIRGTVIYPEPFHESGCLEP
jgi:putative acetyltransferase